MPSPRNTSGLRGDRDREIIEHVARHRLSTPTVLYELFFRADGVETNAVTKVTSRLTERDFLRRHPLYESYSYFTLGKRGAKTAGLNTKRIGGPLGPQALYRDLGMLHFCALRPTERTKLTVREINAAVNGYPELRHRGLKNDSYYVESNDADGQRLGLVWVDGGGPVDHVLRKIQYEFIAPRMLLPGLRRRIEESRFVLAIVTYQEDKKQELLAGIKHLRTPVLFRVEAVEELFPLVLRR